MNTTVAFDSLTVMIDGFEQSGLNTLRKRKKKMVDPYELHPEHPPTKKTATIFLTKDQVYDIINKEMLRIEKLTIPTWGYTKDDLFEVAENIVEQIESYINVKTTY